MSGWDEFVEAWFGPSFAVGVDELRRKVFLRRARNGMVLEVGGWAPDGADGTQWVGGMYERALRVDRCRLKPDSIGLHAGFVRGESGQ